MSNPWLKNLIEYFKTGEVGTCPKCGSIDIKVLRLNHGRESTTFSCNNCKSFAHFDGARTQNN